MQKTLARNFSCLIETVGALKDRDGQSFMPAHPYMVQTTLQEAIKKDLASTGDLAKFIQSKEGALSKVLEIGVPKVKELKGSAFKLLWEVRTSDVLTAEEKGWLASYISGQCSDGWGEGFEQRPLETEEGDEFYASTWVLEDSKPKILGATGEEIKWTIYCDVFFQTEKGNFKTEWSPNMKNAALYNSKEEAEKELKKATVQKDEFEVVPVKVTPAGQRAFAALTKKYDVYEYSPGWFEIPEEIQNSPTLAPFKPYLKKLGTFDLPESHNKEFINDLLDKLGVTPGQIMVDEVDEKDDVGSISHWKEPAYVYGPAGFDITKY